MIYRLEVKLKSGMYMPEEKVSRVLEVAGSCNLENLCLDILRSIDFDFDHMYEFIFPGAKTMQGAPDFSKKSVCRNTKLFSLGLREKDKFRFVYDFGDDWTFDITVKKIIDKPGAATMVVKSVGTVEQYPDFDEWEEDVDWDDEDYEEDLDEDFDEDWDNEDLDEPFDEEIRYDYTAPDQLFEIAFSYKKTKLWKKLCSNDIFAVKFFDGRTGYISIMGNDGQHFAIGIYIGEEGLRSLKELVFSEPLEDYYEEIERLMEQNCLQLTYENKDYLQEAKTLKLKNTVECKIARFPKPVVQEDGSAPFYPAFLFTVDHKNGKILPPTIFDDYDKEPVAALDSSIKNFADIGFIPKTIWVSDDRTEKFLGCFKDEFGTEIVRKKEMSMLDEALLDMLDTLGGGSTEEAEEEYEEMLDMVEEIVSMPDKSVKTMPKELKDTLKELLEAGVLPPELADKLSRKLGKR